MRKSQLSKILNSEESDQKDEDSVTPEGSETDLGPEGEAEVDVLSESEARKLNELNYLLRHLDHKSLNRVLTVLNKQCNVSSIIKETAPEVYNKYVIDSEMVLDEATGIQLLDEAGEAVSGKECSSEMDFDEGFEAENGVDYTEISKLVPIRLNMVERKMMRLLESTMHVSEYTDKVDIIHEGSKNRVMMKEIKEIFSVLTALAIAYNFDAGKKLLNEHDYYSNKDFFCNIFEIGRRYKILNPDKMRTSYGKLMYFLMDTQKPEIRELLNFNPVIPVNTVYSYLKGKKNGLQFLKDDRLKHAIKCIIPENKSRYEIEREICKKEEAIRYLVSKYGGRKGVGSGSAKLLSFSFLHRSFCHSREASESESGEDASLSPGDIETCIYSLNDYNTNIEIFNVPIDKMIGFLKANYNPLNPVNPSCPGRTRQGDTELYDLSISFGVAGSRLSHSHGRQYLYVLQSLSLWREICREFYALWYATERDLLSGENAYRLKNTGQGLHRVQECLNVLGVMRRVLRRVQLELGSWVGSSTIHLGDHNVPNSLLFIDKYLQIPRILLPITNCIERLPGLYEDENLRVYIDAEFGGLSRLKMTILTDFFRHAFDGSGADNFNDAGSCIDGRLTSAWNWCSKIEKKGYFNIFLLSGFNGFDGRFNE